MEQTSCLNLKLIGHVLIEEKDPTTGEKTVLIDKHNAMHARNMSLIVGRGLVNADKHTLYTLRLGSGGSSMNADQTLTYNSPNVNAANATLYNQVHVEYVENGNNLTPTDNSTILSQPTTGNYAIVVVTATIASNEGNGTDPVTGQVFDEIGLFSEDNKLLSHMIFSPIYKTAQKELVITYVITIALA